MAKILDEYQKKLFDLIKRSSDELEGMTLQEVWEQIWINYPQWVVNKLKQLENKWYIRKDDNGIYRALRDIVEEIFYFPVIWFAQCGNLAQTSLSDFQSVETMAFPTKELPISSNEDLWWFFFTRAKWSSMLPDIKSWDLVLVKQQPVSNSTDKTLLIHNGVPKIKYYTQNGDTAVLVSLNKDVEDMEIINTDEVEIVGVVKKIISSH